MYHDLVVTTSKKKRTTDDSQFSISWFYSHSYVQFLNFRLTSYLTDPLFSALQELVVIEVAERFVGTHNHGDDSSRSRV
jgi:hypothetical protein